MLDCDGTLIPYDYEALPSEKVASAIQKAHKKVLICIVTGRSYFWTKPIIKKLKNHVDFVVLNNGAHILDLKTGKLLFEQALDKNDVEQVVDIFAQEKIPINIKKDVHDENYFQSFYKKGDPLIKPSMVITQELYKSDHIDKIIKRFSNLSNIHAYKTHHTKGFGINMQHTKATKLKGIEIVLEKCNLKRDKVIGIGDSYNDFSLLMACGLKVAMGNAVPDLKSIADYIAPSVDDDGVADVIEKFILSDINH